MPKPIAGQARAQRVAPAFLLGRLFLRQQRRFRGCDRQGDGPDADLHAQGCTAAPPGVALIKPLRALMARDGWSVLALPDDWDALQSPGQAAYPTLLLADSRTCRPR